MTTQPTDYPLRSLYFYMTQGCNLNCRHCWIVGKGRKKAEKLPMQDLRLFESILEQALPLGLRRIKLTGGEPFAHPGCATFLDMIRPLPVRLNIETNGTLITPGLARKISKKSNTHVSVSLDGSRARTHDGIRGVKGAFDKAIQGIRNLQDNGLRPQIVMTLMRENVEQIVDLVEMCGRIDVASIKFNVMTPILNAETLFKEQKNLTIQELLVIHRTLVPELESRFGIKIIMKLPHAFTPLQEVSSCGGKQGSCGIKGVLGVLATGHYALCGIGENIPEMVFGNAAKDSLEHIWRNHPVLSIIRHDLPEQFEGICGQCLHQSSCFGSCIAMNYYSARRLNADFWFCRQAFLEGLFPRQRLINPDIEEVETA